MFPKWNVQGLGRGFYMKAPHVVFVSVCFLVSFSVAFAPAAWAQSLTGTISGTVTDPSNAAVVSATVFITNADTSVKAWTGVTNASGIYRAPDLPLGRYSISVEANGFKHQQISNITLSVDQRVNIDVIMQMGAVAETVNVEGSAAGQLQTETGSLGSIVTPSQLQDMPLPSRNPLNLLILTPGVSSGGEITSQGGLSTSQLSVNGSRTLNSEFLIDGVSVVTGSTGGPQSLPPTDSLAEFKVLASSYSAEYGRASGAVVSMVTASGTNIWHGAAYGYFRNEAMDANNYFNNLNDKKHPEDRYNLFGGKIGGPLSIPKVYDGKNRTFFFVNYEGLIQASPYSNLSSVPSSDYAQGNFSASKTVVDNPATKTPFPSNVIPTALLNPSALKILALVPGPNSAGTLNATDNIATNNFLSIGSSHPKSNTGMFRIDEVISDHLRVFVTFVHFNNFSPVAPTFPGSVLDSSVGDSQTTGYETSLGLTKTWSPTLITDLRFSFFRNNSEIRPPSDGISDATTLGIANQFGIAAPEFNISAFSMLGTNSNTLRSQIDNNYQTTLDNTKSIGKHLLQFGFQLRKNQFDDFNPTADVNGSYSFDGSLTSAKNTSGDGINALADFLLGDIKTASYSLPQPLIGRRNYNLALYLQNSWKAKPNLTVNFGLRWEYESPFTAAHNEYSRVDPTTGQVLFAGTSGVSPTLNLSAPKTDFAPRIGVAWSVIPKTVIRAGVGMFYAGIFSNLGGQVLFPGYNVEQAFANLGTGKAQPFTLSQGMPLVATNDPSNPQANIAQFNSASNPLTLSAYDGFTEVKQPYAAQWNFGVERQLPKGLIASVNYVGSHGVHLAVNLPTNYPPYNVALDNQLALTNTSLSTQQARPFPTIGTFNSLNYEGTSTYQALQASVRRQFGDNFAFIANYTRSKSLDDASGTYSFSLPSGLNLGEFPQQFLGINKGLSEFDRPNDLTFAIQYKTTGNKWVRGFLIAPILSAHSGLPIYIGQTNENVAQNATFQQRPDLVTPGVSLTQGVVANGTGEQYLLPAASTNFPLTPTGPFYSGSGATRVQQLPTSIGNLGRDVIRGPGQLSTNIAIGRVFALRERLKMTIRMEAYNVLNHTNFSPSSTIGQLPVSANSAGVPVFNAPNYGLITAAGQARFLQLAARFDF
jgi:hypothetical protein